MINTDFAKESVILIKLNVSDLFPTVSEDGGYECGENRKHLPPVLPSVEENLPPHREEPTNPLQWAP